MSKAAVFGDIHGNSKLLRKLILKLRKEYGNDIKILSCGDLIDRGDDSKGVIDLCIKEGIESVAGNHDYWVIELLEQQTIEPTLLEAMKCRTTLKSYGIDIDKYTSKYNYTDAWSSIAVDFISSLPDEHFLYFVGMNAYHMIDNLSDKKYWLTHCGLSNLCAARYLPDNKNEIEMFNICFKTEIENYFLAT